MITLISLWLPILLSAVAVFIASSIIHMLLPIHRKDFGKVPDEEKVMEDLRKYDIPPGEYVIPCAGDMKEMGSPEFIEKLNKGPALFMTVMKSGQQSMAKSLVLWFLYCVVVGIFSAYIASRAVGLDYQYLTVFRFVGATAFIGYTLALWQNTIWYKRSYKITLKSTIGG